MRTLAVLLLTCAGLNPQTSSRQPEKSTPIEILVGPGKAVTVTIRSDHQSIEGILATFFSRDDKAAEAKFHKLLSESPELTLVLTTKPK